MEADAGLFGGVGGIGFQCQEKILDFLPHLRITQHDIPWLDLTVHFRLHSNYPRSNPA